jgi:hypothetical protein
MEPSTTQGAISCATTWELPSIIWNPMVNYRSHKSSPLVPILSHANLVKPPPNLQISLRSILILSTYIYLRLPSGLFPYGFPTNSLYMFLFSPSVLHAPPSSSSLTYSTNHEAPCYAVFSILLLLNPSQIKFSPVFKHLQSVFLP